MALDSYGALQTAVLGWLARPGDPKVQPAVADFIRLFEVEAERRVKKQELRASLTATGTAVVPLPADYAELRQASIAGLPIHYITPEFVSTKAGQPNGYTIVGSNLVLSPAPSGTVTVDIIYYAGVPPLSDAAPSNWLLVAAPDCYLFGSLVEATPYIGDDERSQMWLGRRESAFASLEVADRKARWAGPLAMRVQGATP